MAEVLRTRRRYRAVIWSNDHAPAHVHVIGKDFDARVRLNCPRGPVEYMDHKGTLRRDHLNEFLAEIAERHADCCRMWKEIHG